MGKADDIEYLEDERKKLWRAVIELDEKWTKRTPEHEADARQASKKASEFRNKSEASKNTILQFEEEAKTSLGTIEDSVEYIINKRNEAIANSEFIESNAEISTKLLEQLQGRIDNINNNLQDLETTFSDHDEYLSQINELEQLALKGQDVSAKIDLIHKNVLAKRKDIDELYLEIFGYKETDDAGEEHKVQGLKYELEVAYEELTAQLDTFKGVVAGSITSTKAALSELKSNQELAFTETVDNWRSEHAAISKQIRDLLPNALTAGLSSAYTKKKEDEVAEIIALTRKFDKSIFYLVLCSMIPFAVSITFLVQGKPLDKVVLELPRLVLAILPLYVPILWIAYSTSKRINLSKRLVEEYTHKEVLGKTFEGLSNQINSIPDSETSCELRVKLLYNILEVSSENPGKLITDYNKADHPLMDALEKSVQLTNAVEKLAQIPGFSKLATVLDKKSKEMLEEKSSKAKAGLATLDKDKEEDEDDTDSETDTKDGK